MTVAPSRRVVAVALIAAAVIAAVYSFSPLTAIVAGLMVALFRAAVRGVSGRERAVVLGALWIGFALRLAALAFLYVTTDPLRDDFHALFGDGRYSIQRSIWILNEWKGVTIGPLYRAAIYYAYGDVGYDRALAVIQWFLAPSPFALTLVSVAAFFGGAVLLYRLVRPAFGAPAATMGLVVLVFWPTFVVWSISMLKESVVLLLSAIAVCAAVLAVRVEGRRRILCAGLVAAAVLLLAPVRVSSPLVVVTALIFGYATLASVRRSAVVVALLAGVAVVGSAVMTRASVQARIDEAVSDAVHYHAGHVGSLGKSYRAADQYFYDRWPERPLARFDEGARFLVRSAAMFVLAPLPSHVVSRSEVSFLPQHFAWFLLVPLACAGAVVGLRRDAVVTGMCAGYCLAGMAAIAPFSGNIGTLVRHRDMIVPFMVWLSALGAVGLLGALPRRRDAAH